MSGQAAARTDISNITNANPCEITTTTDHGYSTGDFVRLTDLNGAMPIPRGEDPLNNYRWKIIVTGDTTFTLKHPVTDLPVDSTNFPPYVEGGFCNLIQTNFTYEGN
jgi:hypothetical protein